MMIRKGRAFFGVQDYGTVSAASSNEADPRVAEAEVAEVEEADPRVAELDDQNHHPQDLPAAELNPEDDSRLSRKREIVSAPQFADCLKEHDARSYFYRHIKQALLQLGYEVEYKTKRQTKKET